jgi:hypothetical protein
MCNTLCLPACSFHPVFLDLQPEEEDDDWSLSSPEDENQADDHVGKDMKDEKPDASQGSNPRLVSDKVIEILDDDDNIQVSAPPPQHPQHQQPNSNDKYKTRLKQLLKKHERITKLNQELIEQDKKRSADHRELQERVQGIDEEMAEFEEEAAETHRMLEFNKVELSRQRSQVGLLEQELTRWKERATKAEAAIKTIRKEHQLELSKAQSMSMVEVRELSSQHRALTSENIKLKETLAIRDSRIRRLEDMLSDKANKSIQDLPEELYQIQKQQKRAVKAMNIQRDEEDLQERQEELLYDRHEVQSRLRGKASAQAARMCRASEKKLSVASTKNVSIVLQERNLNAKKRSLPGSIIGASKTSKTVACATFDVQSRKDRLGTLTETLRPQPQKDIVAMMISNHGKSQKQKRFL